MKTPLLLFCALAFLACNKPAERQTTIIPYEVKGKHFSLWTQSVGKSETKKLLLLAGGPGCTHEYFEGFEGKLPDDVEIIYYDQLGTGKSSNPNDTNYWDLDRYVEEVEYVRQALGLDSTNFYLLGHSWGGILAMQYALKYQQHMKGLIISNMMSDAVAYGRYADEVLGPQMPPEVLAEVNAIEAAKDFSNPRYMELLNPHFYQHHICRIPMDKWPEPMNRSFAQINSSLYVTMQGPSEFGIAGRLSNWDVSGQLKDIQKPTLVIGATHDTMDPKHMEWMSQQLPKGSFLLCPNGSHMCMWDDEATYFKGLTSFFNSQN
ncbi:MAG: hypothetical protein RLZZ77_1341 [Bacteroidota bacterium]